MSIKSLMPGLVQGGSLPRQRLRLQVATLGDNATDRGLVDAPWRALCPRRVLELRDPELLTLQRLPSDTAVALISDSPLSRRRLRSLAHRAGIRIDRELIVLPSTRSPVVILDDDESAVRHFWSSIAAVPPGLARTSPAATATLAVARLVPWRCTGAVAPGRVLIGSRR
jgi:hypothetical protein